MEGSNSGSKGFPRLSVPRDQPSGGTMPGFMFDELLRFGIIGLPG
jgi:hypothetical protein